MILLLPNKKHVDPVSLAVREKRRELQRNIYFDASLIKRLMFIFKSLKSKVIAIFYLYCSINFQQLLFQIKKSTFFREYFWKKNLLTTIEKFSF